MTWRGWTVLLLACTSCHWVFPYQPQRVDSSGADAARDRPKLADGPDHDAPVGKLDGPNADRTKVPDKPKVPDTPKVPDAPPKLSDGPKTVDTPKPKAEVLICNPPCPPLVTVCCGSNLCCDTSKGKGCCSGPSCCP